MFMQLDFCISADDLLEISSSDDDEMHLHNLLSLAPKNILMALHVIFFWHS